MKHLLILLLVSLTFTLYAQTVREVHPNYFFTTECIVGSDVADMTIYPYDTSATKKLFRSHTSFKVEKNGIGIIIDGTPYDMYYYRDNQITINTKLLDSKKEIYIRDKYYKNDLLLNTMSFWIVDVVDIHGNIVEPISIKWERKIDNVVEAQCYILHGNGSLSHANNFVEKLIRSRAINKSN